MAEILTIVVTFNGMQWIERCLKTALESKEETDVMVIDNASEDGTADWVLANHPDVLLRRNEENIGFGAANNIGMKYALENGYNFVYLLNQDAWVFPETLSALKRALVDRSLKAGIASPMQMDAKLSKMDSQFKKKCGKLVNASDSETVVVPFVMASHWMISRQCLTAVGGFSPAFPHYGEDNDFINRAAWYGYSAVVVKSAMAVHDRSARKRPKEYRMNLKNINARVAVANPKNIPLFAILGQTFKLAGMGCLHFSTTPWKGIGQMWSSFKELRNVRKEARKECAFLEWKSAEDNA